MDYTRILIRPLLTEKATFMKETDSTVAFMVSQAANKIEVKKAVEAAFNVKVESVNLIRRRPLKRKRFGRVLGRVPGYKKAYVKLAPGEKIEFFQGV